MRALAIVPFLAFAAVACSNNVTDIHAESTGATASGAGGHATQGAGTGAGAGASATSTTGAGGSGPGSCCSEPVHVAGHVKTLTADTDLAQLATYVVPSSPQGEAAKVVTGPFVVTDVVVGGSTYMPFYITQSADCSALGPNPAILLEAAPSGSSVGQQHGARALVPAGWTLCLASSTYGATVNGFRPY